MAHPDEGYNIPDDEWDGWVDPETGEIVYRDDPYAFHRLSLIRAQMKTGSPGKPPGRALRTIKEPPND